MNCGVCGGSIYHHAPTRGSGGRFDGSVGVPPHSDAELAETKQAVDLAARVLAVFVLIDMARRVVAA